MQQLPPYAAVAEVGKKCLPQRRTTRNSSQTMSLVLDLDEVRARLLSPSLSLGAEA